MTISSFELQALKWASERAIILGKERGHEARFSTGFCAMAAKWLADSINSQNSGSATFVSGYKWCRLDGIYTQVSHCWVLLAGETILDPTFEQFAEGENYLVAKLEDRPDYVNTLEPTDTYPAWQKPVPGTVAVFGEGFAGHG